MKTATILLIVISMLNLFSDQTALSQTTLDHIKEKNVDMLVSDTDVPNEIETKSMINIHPDAPYNIYLGDRPDNIESYTVYKIDEERRDTTKEQHILKDRRTIQMIRWYQDDKEWKKEAKIDYEYTDENGSYIAKLWNFVDGRWEHFWKFDIKYNSDGDMLLYESYKYNLGEYQHSSISEYDYENGREIYKMTKRYDNGVITYGSKIYSKYDQFGKNLFHRYEKLEDGEWVFDKNDVFKYSNTNKMVSREYYLNLSKHGLSDSLLYFAYYFKYDDADSLIEMKEYACDGMYEQYIERHDIYKYNERKLLSNSYKYEFQDGKLTLRSYDTTAYNESGDIIFYEIYHYDNEGNESKLKSEYQYYTNGRLFCEDTYYYEGLEVDSIVRNKYKYDKLGNIISHRVQYQDDGRWVNIRLNLKEFDENGRLLRYLKYFFENNEMILTHEQTYKYNSLGLVIEKTSHLVTCGDQFTRSLYDRDEYGQNIKITKHYSSPHMEYTETTEYTYEYYENGLLKESNMFVIRDDEILKDNISKSYEYDKHQRLTKKFSERVQLGGNGLNFLPYISDLNFHENSERKDSLYIRNGGYGIDIVWKEDPTTVAHVNTDNLSMAHPNPFVEETTIDYELSTNDIIKIELADASGRIVYSALEGIKNAGTNQIKVNARNLVSGIYFYRIIGDHHLLTGQIVVQK